MDLQQFGQEMLAIFLIALTTSLWGIQDSDEPVRALMFSLIFCSVGVLLIGAVMCAYYGISISVETGSSSLSLVNPILGIVAFIFLFRAIANYLNHHSRD